MARPKPTPARAAAAAPAATPVASAPGAASSASRWAWLIAALVLISFWPALTGGVLWDDPGHLTRPDLRSFDGLWRIWTEIGATQQYYPVLHSAFWLEHRLWGDATLGYHAINLVWHAGAAILLGLILRRLSVPGGWLAAVLFAVHPVCVESVAWMSEQKNTLSLFLYLAAALAYLKFEDERRPRWYVVALALFVLALFSKTVTASLPAALLVIAWWRHGRLEWRRDWVPLLPWLALGVAGGLGTAWFEHEHIGAQGEAFALGPVERVLVAGRAPWFYLGKLLWPHALTFVYARWNVDAATWWQYAFPLTSAAVLIGLLVFALRRGRRGPLAVALLFVGTLFPVLGFVNVFPFTYSFVADHFQYHASLAIFAGVAALLVTAGRRCGAGVAWSAAIVLVVSLGALTWRQSRDYRDVFTLFESTLARNPAAWMAHNNLGIALVDDGRAGEALPHYEAALRVRPDLAEVENNWGFALLQLGRFDEAETHLRRAIALRANYPQARANLADALAAAGKGEASLALLRETVQLYPQNGDSHFNLGLGLARAGRPAEAVAPFAEAVRLRPDSAKYVLHVGLALADAKRLDDARPHFRRALELEPGSSLNHYMVGRVLLHAGRPDEAARELSTAVQLDEDNADAQAALAEALRILGRMDESRQHAETARRLRGE